MNIQLSAAEINTLLPMLEKLLYEGSGVDIWLAPGGVLDVNEEDSDAECFLDADDVARKHLEDIVNKMIEAQGMFVFRVMYSKETKGEIPDGHVQSPILGVFESHSEAIDAAESYIEENDMMILAETSTDTSFSYLMENGVTFVVERHEMKG